MALHAKWLGSVGRSATSRFVAAVMTAGVLGGTAVAETPGLAEHPRPLVGCEVVEHEGMLELGAVMQIITFATLLAAPRGAASPKLEL